MISPRAELNIGSCKGARLAKKRAKYVVYSYSAVAEFSRYRCREPNAHGILRDLGSRWGGSDKTMDCRILDRFLVPSYQINVIVAHKPKLILLAVWTSSINGALLGEPVSNIARRIGVISIKSDLKRWR